MSQVFISYASEDRSRAKTLAQALEQRGFSTWWDRKIPFGKAYDEVIAESLAEAQCVLVLWTGLSVDSRWVRSEASEAAAREVLIPVLMERDVKIPLEFRLLQAADLCDWQGDPDYPELQVLVAQIESRLAQVTAGGATAGAQKPPAAGRGEARETSTREPPIARCLRGIGAGADPQRTRRRKLAHFVGFILIPSVAICAAAALAMTWRLPTRVQLDLVVNRVTFTLSGNQPVDVPANALSFAMLSIENFDKVVFKPKRLRVQRDAAGRPDAGAAAWKEARNARGDRAQRCERRTTAADRRAHRRQHRCAPGRTPPTGLRQTGHPRHAGGQIRSLATRHAPDGRAGPSNEPSAGR